jgi:hypothetical protein
MLSCILALGLTPAWLQVVPLMVDSEDEIAIPFAEIGTTLAAVIVPAFIGSFIHWLGQVKTIILIFFYNFLYFKKRIFNCIKLYIIIQFQNEDNILK